MPIHDWTRVDTGLFHDFHQCWTAALSDVLNTGGLPSEYFALLEQNVSDPAPDKLTRRLSSLDLEPTDGNRAGSALAVAAAPPRARVVRRNEVDIYAGKANRITVRHRHGDVVAVIAVVSPGNKATWAEFRAFVEKSSDLIHQGVHLLVVDLFPPGPRDPSGVHKAIWDQFTDDDFTPPPDKPLTAVAYDAGPPQVAYVEPIAVGDALPEMPLFLKPESYVPAPLEAAYQAAWAAFPAALKPLLAAPPPGEQSGQGKA